MSKIIQILIIIGIGGGISEWLGYNAGALLGLIGYCVTILFVLWVIFDESSRSHTTYSNDKVEYHYDEDDED